MEEIKIGEYVRTSIGKIYKLTEKKQEQIENYPGFLQYIEQKSIVKHSPNIIDLIEVGDYVNGHLVLKVEEDKFLLIDDKGYTHLAPINIKSIVTKEQFQSVEYRLEE